MKTEEYRKLAMRTVPNLSIDEMLLNAALGLAGESGEVADHIKKFRFQGHALNKEDVKNELGDIMWYIALAATALEITLDDIMQSNVDKLLKRYPGKGFESERSINRED